MNTKPKLLQDAPLGADDLILQLDVVLIEDDRRDRSAC